MARLFLAVWPPEDVVDHLTTLHRKDQRGVRFVPPDTWHVTLRFLGEADPGAVDDALTGFVPEPTTVRLGPAVDVLAERALVVPASGLDPVATEVAERTRHVGEPPRRRFVGHLTLARLKPFAHMPRVLGALVDLEFELDEVALVQSRLHPDGARYETIASWPVG
ncbi:MAG: RNA 2',3'-cyclic phosphodiesterase [Ilumatobacteraceae bacterium]|nr:RNA 2',3'-cyclic phosphodiesterase [Acidimicrobiales bacterium]MCB9392525.1 RNA 2',3'-cyclic phosphodiesterase [Acidimicrobiaceae bacterium]